MSIGALFVFTVRRVEVATGISLVGMSRPAHGLALDHHPLGFFLLSEQVGSLFLLVYLFGYPLIDILDSSPRALLKHWWLDRGSLLRIGESVLSFHGGRMSVPRGVAPEASEESVDSFDG